MFQSLGIALAGLLAAKADGKIQGLLVSKTVAAATVGNLALLWPLIPRVLAKDPEAIGNAVLIILTYLGVLYGRYKVNR